MSLRSERIKRRLRQRGLEGKEYKALSSVGRPLPRNGESVSSRAAKAFDRADNPKYRSERYVCLADRDWDGEVEVIEDGGRLLQNELNTEDLE